MLRLFSVFLLIYCTTDCGVDGVDAAWHLNMQWKSHVHSTIMLQLLGDFVRGIVPQAPYRGSVPGSRCGTSAPRLPVLHSRCLQYDVLAILDPCLLGLIRVILLHCGLFLWRMAKLRVSELRNPWTDCCKIWHVYVGDVSRTHAEIQNSKIQSSHQLAYRHRRSDIDAVWFIGCQSQVIAFLEG